MKRIVQYPSIFWAPPVPAAAAVAAVTLASVIDEPFVFYSSTVVTDALIPITTVAAAPQPRGAFPQDPSVVRKSFKAALQWDASDWAPTPVVAEVEDRPPFTTDAFVVQT